MILLDTAGLPARLVSVLMARGAQTPQLTWATAPNRHAKTVLDEAPEDTNLLEREKLGDEAMAAGVRALLYLWSGWPSEAAMHASLAPEAEGLYVQAIGQRQAGDVPGSKELFQKLDGHAVFPELAEYAQDAISAAVSGPLKRLRETIVFAEGWEPYAFADTYDQARIGKLDLTSEQIVRNLQCYEFELLFAHVLDAAVGEKLVRRQKGVVAPRSTPRPPARRPATRPGPTSVAPAGKPKTPEAPGPRQPLIGREFHVLCPKCQTKLIVAESSRGSSTRCEKCAATFLVPARAV